MRILLSVFLFYLFAEVAALVILAKYIGSGGVILYVLLSALVGMWMLRHQQLAALLTLRGIARREKRIPAYSMLWPMRYVLAGLLLILPGVINEVIALLLLLPGPRRKGMRPSSPSSMAKDSIDAEYHRVDDVSDPSKPLR